jgi:hypothetical protein
MASRSPADRGSDWRGDLLLVLGILVLVGPIIQLWSAQPASRYLLSAAVVEHRSLELDPYERLLGLDRAEYRGHTYSDKAPYQPLLAIPFLEGWKAAGGDLFPAPSDHVTVDDLHEKTHRGLWWATFWTVTVPAALLALVMRRLVSAVHPKLAYPVAVAMAVGTILLPFSILLFAHVMAALWLALAWLLVRRPDPAPRAAVAAGLCLGAAIGVEYPCAAVALVILVAVLLAGGLRPAAYLSAATVAATLPLMLYDWLVFENPFEVAYQGHLPNFQGAGAGGVYNLEVPKLDEIGRALFSERGLFVLTPLVLFAFAGCALAITSASTVRRDAVVALAAFILMLVASTGVDGLGGATPGPRYLIPVLPLFALPLAEVWARYPRPCIVATVFGAAWMAVATVTNPLDPNIRDWVDAARDGDFTANVFTGHDHSWLVLVSTVLGFVVLIAAARSTARLAPVLEAREPAGRAVGDAEGA